jgi:hypothetical protein
MEKPNPETIDFKKTVSFCIPRSRYPLPMKRDATTQTYDENYLGIFTPEGKDTTTFYQYVKSNSPDILEVFQNPNGCLSNPISYYPDRYIVKRIPKQEITSSTIVDCA